VIVLGFVGLLLALVLSLAVRVPLFAGIGDRSVQPTTMAALHKKYELGIGNFDVDLSDVNFPLGETHVKTALGIGDLKVRVPEGVAVDVDGEASGGQVVLFGHIEDGVWVDSHLREAGSRPNRVLVLDAEVGLGRVEVTRR
jgi:predicted membrane protein